MHKLILTFDIEDFINPNAIGALQTALEMLEKYRLKALFFITGHMAEKLSNFPEILDTLKKHEIGFHSSGHSVRPIILEYTDVESYQQAYSISLERETSHLNPLTGKIEGTGGIAFLQDLFYPKKIQAFRAPGMSWAPPLLEALRDLGLKFDFSSSLATSTPVYYNGVTFYPYTFVQHWEGKLFEYRHLVLTLLKREVAVFDLHPSAYVNSEMWDSIYYRDNPRALIEVQKRSSKEAAALFGRFELLLRWINHVRNIKSLDVDADLRVSSKNLTISEKDVQKCYEASIGWPTRFFNLKPRFIRAHFFKFFKPAIRR